MPGLIQLLQGQDIGHLRIIAELWGIDLHSANVKTAAEEFPRAFSQSGLARELIEALTPDARRALSALAANRGRLPWAAFAREFGDVREMGAAKRDREHPYLHPISTAEALYYRAMLGRAFFDTPRGPQEFAYLPDEWLPFVRAASQKPPAHGGQLVGRPAIPAERARLIAASDRILDDATTLLAAARMGLQRDSDPVLQRLVQEVGLLRDQAVQAEKVKVFLELPRREALLLLTDAWRKSETFNELRLMPDVVCEGKWSNQPLQTRRLLLGLLDAIPARTWWSLDAFVADIKTRYPDFQRPAGDYDSWFIKDVSTGEYLRGFETWDRVDGALIRFFIARVAHRLGMVDLAGPTEGAPPTAFRIAEAGPRSASFPETERGRLHASSQGRIAASRLVPRVVRYQVARFCEWGEERPEDYRYRITPPSLARAVKQGLKVEQLLGLLAKHAEAGAPASLVKAIKRWEAKGVEARLEAQVVLRVGRPEILKQLRQSRAARFLGEPLGPAAVIVKGGALQKVAEAMAELGFLVEDSTATQK